MSRTVRYTRIFANISHGIQMLTYACSAKVRGLKIFDGLYPHPQKACFIEIGTTNSGLLRPQQGSQRKTVKEKTTSYPDIKSTTYLALCSYGYSFDMNVWWYLSHGHLDSISSRVHNRQTMIDYCRFAALELWHLSLVLPKVTRD